MPVSPIYRGAVRLATKLLPAAARLDEKLRRGHEGRTGALERLVAWGARERDVRTPLIWFHAPSVGEGLQAETVIGRLRTRHPDWQVAYTHFSPSAEGLARRIGASIADYLPYDTPDAAAHLLDALRPSTLIYSKLDVWPELATIAAERGVRVGLIAATVRPGSGRLRWPSRALLAPGYRALSAVGAVDVADAERLARLGARPEVVQVLGDPRYDSVLEKVSAVAPDDPLLRFGRGAPTLVAGSTWPGDEEPLLQAFARVRAARADARLIVVPHEPTTEHLAGIDSAAARFGLPTPVRLSAAEGPASFLVVDRVGVLATLYGGAAIAYVGGGFHAAGLHSVLEPAAWGVPIIVGPRWRESRDADVLIGRGAAVSLPEERPAAVLARIWEEWLADQPLRVDLGRRAKDVVLRGRGAADRCATLVEGLVGQG